MIAIEDYKKAHFEIKEEAGAYAIYCDGKIENIVYDRLEAEDYVDDKAVEFLGEDNKYECCFCNVYYRNDDSVDWKMYPSVYPHGETVMATKHYATPVCPVCGDDLDEC